MKKNSALKILSAIVLAAAMALIGVIAVGAETVMAEDGPCEHEFYNTSGRVWVKEDNTEWKEGDGGSPRFIDSLKRYYVEGTCEQQAGYLEKRLCKKCGQYIPTKIPDAASGHDFAQSAEKVSECDGKTYKTETCTICGYVKVTVTGEGSLVKEHTLVTETVQKLDHTQDGVVVTKCSDCGVILSSTLTTTEGHPLSQRTLVNQTCQHGGRVEEYCGCGFKQERETPQIDHLKAWKYVKEPTCTEDGRIRYTCSFCGQSFPEREGWADEVVPATGHKWVNKGGTNCGDPVTYQECSVCHERQNVSGLVVEHEWKKLNDVEPTCGTDGYSMRKCTRCGKTEKDPDSIVPATGDHKFAATVILKQPSCTETGIEIKKCRICGQDGAQTEIPAVGHKPMQDDGDCTTPVLCSVCEEIVTAAKEHTLEVERHPINRGMHVFVCKNDGCVYKRNETCTGTDDGNCTTPVVCDKCGGTVRVGTASHEYKDGKCIPSQTNPEAGHVIQCTHRDCNITNAVVSPHNYNDDGECVDCGFKKHVHEFGEWESDETGHWKVCKTCSATTEVTPHDVTVKEYAGDCSVAVECSVCGYDVLPAKTTHAWCGEWHDHGETHYQHCTNPGCAVLDEYDHTPEPDDHNCTTPLICSLCKHLIVEAASDHSWSADAKAHDDEYHTLKCTVEGCSAEKQEKHTAGIAATCNSQAECITCHSKFGKVDSENHVGGTEIRDAKPATTTEEGYTGDKYCVGCGAKLEEGTVIEKLPEEHVHVYDGYEYDADGHWAVCKCGEKDPSGDKAPHTFGAYTNNGATHSRTCTVCGEVDDEPHEHGEAVHDCTKAILCADCGAIIEEAQTSHNFTGRVVGTEAGHTVACVNPNCDVTTDVTAHTGGSASCTSGAHCEICGVEYTEKDASVHTGGTELRDHKDATTTEEGYTGDTYCLGCGEIISEGTTIEKLPEEHEHAFGDWMADGTHHWRECACGDESERAEHTYENGKCTVCGASDPNYTIGDVLIDKDVTLTPEENKEYYAGLMLVVENVAKDDEEYADVEKTVGKKFETFMPFDISLINKADDNEVQPNGKITVTVPVPSGWKADETSLYHVSGRKMEKIDVTVSSDGAHVVFTTDHLSIYVLVNTSSAITKPVPVPPTPGTTDPSETTKDPDETTKGPDETTKKPNETTKEPEETTKEPDETTKEPDETTKEPDEITKEPETTRKPEETGKTEPPKTGNGVDMTAVCVILIMSSVCGACVVCGVRSKRRY